MYIDNKHYTLIKSILNPYLYTFYAFGSRVKGKHKKFSDLDLCYFENIPLSIIAHIEEDFEESDLPYKVDIINWQTCEHEFRKIIKNDLTRIQASQFLLTLDSTISKCLKQFPSYFEFMQQQKDIPNIIMSYDMDILPIVSHKGFTIIEKINAHNASLVSTYLRKNDSLKDCFIAYDDDKKLIYILFINNNYGVILNTHSENGETSAEQKIIYDILQYSKKLNLRYVTLLTSYDTCFLTCERAGFKTMGTFSNFS